MKENIYHVTTGSPQELQAKLSAELKKGRFDYQFISVSFNDPRIYVYPFHLPDGPRPQVKEQLIEEAIQLLSLKEDNIELEFQVFGKHEDMIDGVFACMPKALLEEYVEICDNARLIPVHFTSQLLTCIGAMFKKHKEETDRFCILDFAKDKTINLAVFCNNKCEFLRQIRYEKPNEARSDVLQSLRSACAKSEVKSIEEIYVGGAADEHDTLIKEITNDTGAKIMNEDFSRDMEDFDFRDNYFQVNLVNNYSFALPRRKQMLLASHIVLGILVLFLGISLVRLVSIQSKISKIRATYNSDDVQYARELQKKVESLPDET